MSERTNIAIDGSRECRGCPLALRAFVPGAGVSPCSLMVVGCAPGAEEEDTGLPFQGKTGRMLREILSGLGLEDRTYFTNVVKRRPVKYKALEVVSVAPTRQEIYTCGHHLAREIEKLKPALILTLGATALAFLSGRRDLELSEVHGLPMRMTRFGMHLTILPTYDGGYVMRNGGLASEVGSDWIDDIQSIPDLLERT